MPFISILVILLMPYARHTASLFCYNSLQSYPVWSLVVLYPAHEPRSQGLKAV